jgi:hypothetical protein
MLALAGSAGRFVRCVFAVVRLEILDWLCVCYASYYLSTLPGQQFGEVMEAQ